MEPMGDFIYQKMCRNRGNVTNNFVNTPIIDAATSLCHIMEMNGWYI